jgi:small subunit ribosomal protein S16
MVVIRLARGGATGRPFYHIVVADSRKARDGRYIEKVGYFNPIARGGEVPLFIKKEQVENWLLKGAKPSCRVARLLKKYKTEQTQVEQKIPPKEDECTN